MFFIDENTPRETLLDAVYDGGGYIIDAFIAADKDPEHMETEELRKFIVAWIEEGDECAAA